MKALMSPSPLSHRLALSLICSRVFRRGQGESFDVTQSALTPPRSVFDLQSLAVTLEVSGHGSEISHWIAVVFALQLCTLTEAR